MRNVLLFLILMTAAVAGTVFLFSNRPVQKIPTVSEKQAPSAPLPNIVASQEKNGVTVTLEKIEQRNDATVVKLALNNHQYDLSKDEIYLKTTLNGAFPLSRTILSNASGGHHVETEIAFPKTMRGIFMITPIEGNSFEFDNLWK